MSQQKIDIHELIAARRSIRQFRPKQVPRELLDIFIDAGRLAPSAANLQPLEFIVVDDSAVRKEIFPCLKWAAYINPRGNPNPGQEPAAYVIVLVNLNIREKMYEYDVGAAVENMALASAGEGIASCWLISIDRPEIQSILGIPEHLRVDSVLALGYPAETSVVEEYRDSPKYWKDEAGLFHVPKRDRTSVAHFNKY
jgi:nitroreductase